MTINIDKLKDYSLFGGLDHETITYLRSLMREEHFKRGQTIFLTGSDGDEVCFIVEGQVSIVAKGNKIAQISEGEQFGEMHIIDIMPRSADVIADTEGRFLALHHGDLFKLRKLDPDAFSLVMLNCSRDISRRLRHMNENYVKLLESMEKKI